MPSGGGRGPTGAQRAPTPRGRGARGAANPGWGEWGGGRLAGKTATPEGGPVRGREGGGMGRRPGRRKARRWANAWSPAQIAHRPPLDFPDDDSMRVSHEAIYQ